MDRRLIASLLATYPTGIPPADIERVVRLVSNFATAADSASVPALNGTPVHPPRPTIPPRRPAPQPTKAAAPAAPPKRRQRAYRAPEKPAHRITADEDALLDRVQAHLAKEPMTAAHLEEAVGAPGRGVELAFAAGASKVGTFETPAGDEFAIYGYGGATATP